MTPTGRIVAALGGRRSAAIFYAIVLGGAALALGLGIAEVYNRPPLEFGEERVRREGLVATVLVGVRNRSDEPICPEIRIAARDREGLDLEEVVARSEGVDEGLAPGQTVTYVGEFRRLTRIDYQEKLDEFAAYAFKAEPCPPQPGGVQR